MVRRTTPLELRLLLSSSLAPHRPPLTASTLSLGVAVATRPRSVVRSVGRPHFPATIPRSSRSAIGLRVGRWVRPQLSARTKGCPRQDSNLRHLFRRQALEVILAAYATQLGHPGRHRRPCRHRRTPVRPTTRSTISTVIDWAPGTLPADHDGRQRGNGKGSSTQGRPQLDHPVDEPTCIVRSQDVGSELGQR
jgi:hypothetical protein